VKKRAVQAYGGLIIECAPTVASREETAARIIRETGAHLVHPYNDVRVIAGQGTATLELLEDVPDLDLIVAPVSGGGLLSGTAIAAKGLRQEIRIVGTEPRNADDAFRSFASGKIEPASTVTTMADGLRATLCPLTFSILRQRVDAISLVEEAEIVSAMQLIWERLKVVVEPSGAVAAVPALLRRLGTKTNKVGIILTGGNLDLTDLPFARQ
jgi:threonine dehydratase